MSCPPLAGRARRFGADINTDAIIASRRKRDTIDPMILRQWLFEDLAPGFAASVAPGDILVADANFGCGSAMEVAVTALQAAGIRALLAPSFARTYYRNAVNNGLPPLICDTTGIAEGDQLEIHTAEIHNRTRDTRIAVEPLPPMLQAVLDAGGLVPFLKRHGDWPE